MCVCAPMQCGYVRVCVCVCVFLNMQTSGTLCGSVLALRVRTINTFSVHQETRSVTDLCNPLPLSPVHLPCLLYNTQIISFRFCIFRHSISEGGNNRQAVKTRHQEPQDICVCFLNSFIMVVGIGQRCMYSVNMTTPAAGNIFKS